MLPIWTNIHIENKLQKMDLRLKFFRVIFAHQFKTFTTPWSWFNDKKVRRPPCSPLSRCAPTCVASSSIVFFSMSTSSSSGPSVSMSIGQPESIESM